MDIVDYLAEVQKLIIVRCEKMMLSTFESLGTYRSKSDLEPLTADERLCRAGEIVATCHREMTALKLWPPCFSKMSLATIVYNLSSLQMALASFVPGEPCCLICNMDLNRQLLELTYDMEALAKSLCLKCVMANMQCRSIGKNCGSDDPEKCNIGYGCHEDLMKV